MVVPPDDLGLSIEQQKRIKELQVFGIPADELWSFVKTKKNKLKYVYQAVLKKNRNPL